MSQNTEVNLLLPSLGDTDCSKRTIRQQGLDVKETLLRRNKSPATSTGALGKVTLFVPELMHALGT